MPFLRAVAVMALLAVVVVLATVAGTGGSAPPGYPLPAPGEVVPIVAPDGAPAFLARADDGTVRAFLGIAPHSGWPLAWCPAARQFVEPGGASMFDLAGRYTFGPAQGGLRPYAVGLDRDQVTLGALQPPSGRTPAGTAPAPTDDLCLQSEGHLLGQRAPTRQMPVAASVTAAAFTPRWTRAEATLHRAGDRIRVCSADLARCPASSPSVPALLEGNLVEADQPWRGQVLLRGNGAGFDAVVAPMKAIDYVGGDRTNPSGSSWCAAGELDRLTGRRVKDRWVLEVRVRGLAPPATATPACDYVTAGPAARPPSPATFAVGGYAAARLNGFFSGGLVAAASRTRGTFPARGGAGDLSADGIVTGAELAAALGITTPVRVVVLQRDGVVTGFWVPPQ